MTKARSTAATPATIRLFLPYGEAQDLRTAEISNWSGKGLAAPRASFKDLLERDELLGGGVYILTGEDSATGLPLAYVGEAEVLRQRMRLHAGTEFWAHAFVFVQKGESLTKAHIRYLEGRLIDKTKSVGRYRLTNSQASSSRLPECDREDMEVFLARIQQLCSVLGCDLLIPIGAVTSRRQATLFTSAGGLKATGRRTAAGFVVLRNSQSVTSDRPSAAAHIVALRRQLLLTGVLTDVGPALRFERDFEFTSPSIAAAVVHGGNMNGLTAWKDSAGTSLRELETRQVDEGRDSGNLQTSDAAS